MSLRENTDRQRLIRTAMNAWKVYHLSVHPAEKSSAGAAAMQYDRVKAQLSKTRRLAAVCRQAYSPHLEAPVVEYLSQFFQPHDDCCLSLSSLSTSFPTGSAPQASVPTKGLSSSAHLSRCRAATVAFNWFRQEVGKAMAADRLQTERCRYADLSKFVDLSEDHEVDMAALGPPPRPGQQLDLDKYKDLMQPHSGSMLASSAGLATAGGFSENPLHWLALLHWIHPDTVPSPSALRAEDRHDPHYVAREVSRHYANIYPHVAGKIHLSASDILAGRRPVLAQALSVIMHSHAVLTACSLNAALGTLLKGKPGSAAELTGSINQTGAIAELSVLSERDQLQQRVLQLEEDADRSMQMMDDAKAVYASQAVHAYRLELKQRGVLPADDVVVDDFDCRERARFSQLPFLRIADLLHQCHGQAGLNTSLWSDYNQLTLLLRRNWRSLRRVYRYYSLLETGSVFMTVPELLTLVGDSRLASKLHAKDWKPIVKEFVEMACRSDSDIEQKFVSACIRGQVTSPVLQDLQNHSRLLQTLPLSSLLSADGSKGKAPANTTEVAQKIKAAQVMEVFAEASADDPTISPIFSEHANELGPSQWLEVVIRIAAMSQVTPDDKDGNPVTLADRLEWLLEHNVLRFGVHSAMDDSIT